MGPIEGPSVRAARPPSIRVADPAAEDPTERMAREVRDALASSPRWLPSKYFYDDRGSALFEKITTLPEYYLTRAEAEILETEADALLAATRPTELFEIGSGSGRKTRRLVEAGLRAGSLEAVTFFDVHRASLEASLESLAREHPRLLLSGIVGDFERDLGAVPPRERRMALFLGGTIGNLHPDFEVPRFLREFAGRLGEGGTVLLGVDLEKDPAVLEAAYDDAQGVTAEFNRNVLRVVNRRLGGDFVPEAFEHVAFYDRERRWIEMRLRATRAMRVRIEKAGVDLALAAGEEIRTEISCRYTRESLERRLAGAGLSIARWMTDRAGRFALALLART